MRKINEIIVHCSATPDGRAVTVAQIDAWHRKRGFRCIGYHFVIYLDGSIHKGRPVAEIGAHCLGHNADSIGICYVGGLATDNSTPMDTRTPQQKAALRNLITELRHQFPMAVVHGHREFANKACPCFDAAAEYKNI